MNKVNNLNSEEIITHLLINVFQKILEENFNIKYTLIFGVSEILELIFNELIEIRR
jgi:hypothetical protein